MAGDEDDEGEARERRDRHGERRGHGEVVVEETDDGTDQERDQPRHLHTSGPSLQRRRDRVVPPERDPVCRRRVAPRLRMHQTIGPLRLQPPSWIDLMPLVADNVSLFAGRRPGRGVRDARVAAYGAGVRAGGQRG